MLEVVQITLVETQFGFSSEGPVLSLLLTQYMWELSERTIDLMMQIVLNEHYWHNKMAILEIPICHLESDHTSSPWVECKFHFVDETLQH